MPQAASHPTCPTYLPTTTFSFSPVLPSLPSMPGGRREEDCHLHQPLGDHTSPHMHATHHTQTTRTHTSHLAYSLLRTPGTLGGSSLLFRHSWMQLLFRACTCSPVFRQAGPWDNRQICHHSPQACHTPHLPTLPYTEAAMPTCHTACHHPTTPHTTPSPTHHHTYTALTFSPWHCATCMHTHHRQMGGII